MKFRFYGKALYRAVLIGAIVAGFLASSFAIHAAGRSSNVVGPIMKTFDDLVSSSASRDAISRQRKIMAEIVEIVLEKYVNAVAEVHLSQAAIEGMRNAGIAPGTGDPVKLSRAALTAMLTSLDPHSSYIDAEQFREMQVQTRGEFGGLGIEVTMEGGLVKVVSPIDDTPAFHAGLRAGDLITHIDGEYIKGLTLAQAVNRMRGRVGTRIVLTIRRLEQAPFDASITRGRIRIVPVRARLEGDIGYLRITSFSQATESALKEALVSFRAKLGGRLKGIVLDLRNNPGGLLDQAVAVSDSFLERGTVVSIRARTEGQNRSFPAASGDLAEGLPIVVLVNGGSASASEIVSGALQDYRRATVLGLKTFGKGSVQTIFPITGGGAMRLTTAMYYTPLGRPIQARGIIPDISIKGPKGKDASPLKKEADLEGAFPLALDNPSAAGFEIKEESCPALGEKKDPTLGCALAFLRAGSMGAFLASLSVGPQGASNQQAAARPSSSRFPRTPISVTFPKGPERPDDIAVIIGNADYSKQSKDIPDVTPAYADAEDFKRYVMRTLGVREGNIIDLRDATGSQLERVFGNDRTHRGQLFDWVKPGVSRVFVYYAGHGAPSGADGTAYLVPSDADAARIDINGFPLSTFYRNLGQVPAESITVVIEACFSGASQGGSVISNASPVFLKAKAPEVPPNITVISAGGSNQMASWEEDKSHGLFTKYFLKGMSGEADAAPYGNGDGDVDYAELDKYLKDTLTYYARRYYGRDQTAVIFSQSR